MLSFREPAFLWLVVPLALLAAAAGMRLAGRGASARRRMLVLTCRCAAMTLLVVAIAQPITRLTAPQLPAAFIVDSSASISGAARQIELDWLQATVQAARAGTRPQLVSFAAEPTLSAISPTASADVIRQQLAAGLHVGATNIGAAEQVALGSVPDGAQLVLLSDGLQTAGDAVAVAAAAAARHISISTVLLPGPTAPDAALTRAALPVTAHAGDTLPLQLTAWTNRDAPATLRVSQDGHIVGQQAVQLRLGDNPLLVNIPAPGLGWHSFHAAIVMAGDTVAQNNALDAATLVTTAPRLLLVTQNASGSPVAPLLRALGFQVQQAAPSHFPVSLPGLKSYDAVMLDDIPAPALTAQQVAVLERAVRTLGTGLFVLGGSHSLTLGHYSQTPLEHMLPVLSETPSSQQQGNVALQLVLDRSGSMNDLAGGDVPKIVTSQAAASIALDFVVQHKDQLGIVSFDILPHLLYPVQPTATKDVSRVRAIIAAMTADGGTDVYHALQLGLQQVIRSTAPYKHIILMTDGRSEPARYDLLLSQMQRAHVTLSAVALGADADTELLRYLAAKGKGRYYFTNNGSDLPHIFAEEARLSAGSARVVGTIPVALGGSSPVTRSLGTIVPPPIHGYVATVLKREAQADLLTKASGFSGDPVLAQWQYGLGRVLVWAPGSSAAWSGGWLGGQSSLWNDAVRWMLRAPQLATLTPDLLPGESPNRIVIDTQNNSGRVLDLLHIAATVQVPNGGKGPVTFEQTGPGRYEAALPDAGAGIYRLSIGAPQNGIPAEVSLVSVSYAQEYQPRQPDAALLSELATRTNGRILTSTNQVVGPRIEIATGATDYWWILAALALGFFLIDVTVRLSDWDIVDGDATDQQNSSSHRSIRAG